MMSFALQRYNTNQSPDTARLRHMLESSIEACEFMGNALFEDFQKNRMQVSAIVRSLEVVGEAASQVSKVFKDAHPEIEWQVVTGMRNRLIHAYFNIDEAVIWHTVREDLPSFISKIAALLDFPPPGLSESGSK